MVQHRNVTVVQKHTGATVHKDIREEILGG